MKITEWCDLLNLDIVILYYSNQKNRWCCKIEHLEIMENGCLVCSHGNAKTPALAVQAYVDKIKGTKVAINAMLPNRVNYDVPLNLTSI
jgi:hypothetical protein